MSIRFVVLGIERVSELSEERIEVTVSEAFEEEAA